MELANWTAATLLWNVRTRASIALSMIELSTQQRIWQQQIISNVYHLDLAIAPAPVLRPGGRCEQPGTGGLYLSERRQLS